MPAPIKPVFHKGGRTWACIILLLLVGLSLRTYPILWGSEYFHEVQYDLHPDEPKIVRAIDDFPESLRTNHDYRYPTFLHNAIGAAWWTVGSALDLRQPEPSQAGQPAYEKALLFSRALMVLLFGLGGMLLVWAFARSLWNRQVALWALAATSIQAWVVSSTNLVQTDIPAAFGLLAVFFWLLKLDRKENLRPTHGLVAGLILGSATAMKYTSGIGMLALAITWFAAIRRKALDPKPAAGFAGLAFLGALASFLLFVPGAAYDFTSFRISLEYEWISKSKAPDFDWATLWSGLTDCLPLWILVPALLGAVDCLRLKPRTTMLSIAVCLGTYVAISAKAFRPDYAIPLAPFAALFSGVFLWRLSRLGKPWSWLPVAYLIAGHLFVAYVVHARYTQDSRYRFDAWVHENIPPGPLGEGPIPTRRSWASPKWPTGYQSVSGHKRPEWLVLFYRHYLPFLNTVEDPNFYPQFSSEPGKRTLANFTEKDFLFYEDVLLEKDREFHYDLVREFEEKDLPLDMQGVLIQVYKRRE